MNPTSLHRLWSRARSRIWTAFVNFFEQDVQPLTWTFVDSAHVSEHVFHIRLLSLAGRKPKGQLDTPTLCGKRRRTYFDATLPFEDRNIILACPACVKKYRAMR